MNPAIFAESLRRIREWDRENPRDEKMKVPARWCAKRSLDDAEDILNNAIEGRVWKAPGEWEPYEYAPSTPEGLPSLPPVPEGYSRWEYRGMGWTDFYYETDDEVDPIRPIGFSNRGHSQWEVITSLQYHRGVEYRHYIEAVK